MLHNTTIVHLILLYNTNPLLYNTNPLLYNTNPTQIHGEVQTRRAKEPKGSSERPFRRVHRTSREQRQRC